MSKNLKSTVAEATRLTQAGLLPQALSVLTGRAGNTGAVHSPTDRDHSLHSPSNDSIATVIVRLDLSSRLQGFVDFFNKAKHPVTLPLSASILAGHVGAFDPVPLEGASVQAEEFVSLSFSNSAGTRQYKLFTPAVDLTTPLPLIVMLHGCTQNPDDFAAGTRMNELANELGFYVAYPAQPPSANPGRCWNWFNARDQIRDKGEPSLIAGITLDIMKTHAIDPKRVYIAGLSAGGAAAAVMGALYPDLYAAIGVHSGLACGAARDASSAFSAMRRGGTVTPSNQAPLPTIVFHGDQDTTVSPVNAEQVIAQAKAQGSFHVQRELGRSPSGADYTRNNYIDEAGRTVIEQWTVHGANHAWSGGSPAGSYTQASGPDASREMARFFLSHSR